MYLDETEYQLFADVPGLTLSKRRLSFPPLGVDVFASPLEGLIIAEAEFVDDETMTAFVPPSWSGPEITDVPALSGASLAGIASLRPDEASTALAAALATVSP